MRTIKLYRFTRPNGGVTVSTVEPDTEYTELFRLVADEGCVLTNGETTTTCTDTDDPGAWSEIPDVEMTETEEKARAYDIMMGVAE